MTNSTKAPTAAQIRLNHERATTAVARLNDKAWNGIKYTLEADRLDQPAVIVKHVKPYNGSWDAEYKEVLRYTTRIDQTIGWPVSYDNKYSASNHGTMCKGINDAGKTRSRNLEAVRTWENTVDRLRTELAAAEAKLAERKAAAGL